MGDSHDDLLGGDGLFRQLKKALIERALGAELTEHLGYEKGDPATRRVVVAANGPPLCARALFVRERICYRLVEQ